MCVFLNTCAYLVPIQSQKLSYHLVQELQMVVSPLMRVLVAEPRSFVRAAYILKH